MEDQTERCKSREMIQERSTGVGNANSNTGPTADQLGPFGVFAGLVLFTEIEFDDVIFAGARVGEAVLAEMSP